MAKQLRHFLSPCESSTGVQSSQHTPEEMAAGFCFQEEGGRPEEWCGQKRQHVGQTYLQKSTGMHGSLLKATVSFFRICLFR